MKRILTFISALVLTLSAGAQVDNYCLRLPSGGSVTCGEMGELDNLRNFTLQFWMNADQWTSGATLLSRGDGLKVQLGDEGALSFTLNETTFTASSDDLAAGSWVHVMLICKSGVARVYINTTLKATSSKSYTLPESTDEFTIGGDTYVGRLDEIRVWSAVLSSDYEYFYNTTLNKWVPQLDDLVCYFKLDQELCENVVDYKAIFVPDQSFNHHGVMNGGATKELCTDNTKLPYLLQGAYTNNARFYDRAIDRDKYLLANDLIILGSEIQVDNAGHVVALSSNDHGTLNGTATQDASFNDREGVLKLADGEGYMEINSEVLNPTITDGVAKTGYTFETWLYIEEWVEGAYIYRQESDDGSEGFSISLGDPDKQAVVVSVNGNKFVNIKKMPTREWVHFAVTTFAGGTVRKTFLFTYNGTGSFANADLSGSSTDYTPTNLSNYNGRIGEGFKGYFDNTIIWNTSFSESALSNHKSNVLMPAIGKEVDTSTMNAGGGCYLYDDSDDPGFDYYSQDNWLKIMASAYEGYRGYKIRLSVQGSTSDGWQNTIAKGVNRQNFAKDLAALAEPYDGVELDLEWMYGTQTTLGQLSDSIRKYLAADKTLFISCHPSGPYQFPPAKMDNCDGFTFQNYGPDKGLFSLDNYTKSITTLKNYGFAPEKMYMSYSTTTSGGYSNGTLYTATTGIRNGAVDDDYSPVTTGAMECFSYGGYNYWFGGPWQVYNRAKACKDNGLQGIFYWDMGNDVATSHQYSFPKWANYAVNANVDSLVTVVDINYPTGIRDVSLDGVVSRMQLQTNGSTLTVALPGNAKAESVEVFATNGKRALRKSGNATSLAIGTLPSGVYVVSVRTKGGNVYSERFIKQ